MALRAANSLCVRPRQRRQQRRQPLRAVAAQTVADEGYWQSKTVAVTGATGFVGTALVTELLEKGAKVRILCRCASLNGARSQHRSRRCRPQRLRRLCVALFPRARVARSASPTTKKSLPREERRPPTTTSARRSSGLSARLALPKAALSRAASFHVFDTLSGKLEWLDAVQGADAVVNLAGSPISTRWDDNARAPRPPRPPKNPPLPSPRSHSPPASLSPGPKPPAPAPAPPRR